jgi:hypothetical protein
MNGEDIEDNPTFKKLKEDAEEFRRFGRVWPLLRPIAKALGVDTKSIDESLKKAAELARQVNQMTAIPDKFNDIFSEIGWIFIESMELETAETAINLAEKEGIEKADQFLVDYFSPDWVEAHINWLKYINGFQPRFGLAEKALEDYKAGRHYASTLVTLALIDGWVSELNIVDFRRQGFFTEKSEVVAWDSIAAHPKGLMKLKNVFSKPRLMTRSEEITIPYRHGIMHGMDLGYDNKYVAAKCWAALFAVREWAIKATKGELKPPELEPQEERTLWESIETYIRIRDETERLKQWQPRQITVGETVPVSGEATDFPSGTPEQKMVEFLNYWQKNNYGYMADCFAPILPMRPVDVRDSFQNLRLLEYKLVRISDVAAFITDIEVRIKLKKNDDEIVSTYEFRLACNTHDGELAYYPNEDTVWGLTTWRLVQ